VSTDQPIIDIIADSLRDGNADDLELWRDSARDVLAALRAKDYLVLPIERPVVVTPEMLGYEPDLMMQLEANP